MNIDFSKLPSSVKEFFSPQEYAELSEYEKMHLSRMRQNYEALKSFGLKPPPPDFMVKKKDCVKFKSPPNYGRRCRVQGDISSDDSDEDWTPESEWRKEDKPKPFVPYFQPTKRQKTRDVPARKPTSTKKLEKKSPARYSYTLRNRPMMKYMSLAVPDEDDFLYCEDCNMEYPGDCPVHGPLLVVRDKDVPPEIKEGEDPNFNLYTLPDGLEVKTSGIPGAGLGVFANKRWDARTRFGPYKGTKERNEDMAHDSGYCWQIYQNGKPSHFVDAKDPCHSNWMRYVNCARSEDEQCLTAYQHDGEIYYRAHCEIAAGTELLVYYGDNYAKELGIALQKVGRRPEKQKEQHDDIFPCTKCYLAFSTDVFLERHLYRLHYEEYCRRRQEISQISSLKEGAEKFGTAMYGLKGCNERTGQDAQMSLLKGHVCTLCNKRFSCGMSPKQHTKNHNRQNSCECTECGKAFSDSSSLQGHMRIHSGDKPYECTECGKAFSHSGHLQTHMRIHSGDKPYKCTECGKAFSRSGHLQRHMRIHSGDKPYKCTECGKAFSDSSSLQGHMRIHSGDKPYKCTECGKAFSRSGSLQTHMRIHSGDKPYKCTECGKAFSRSGDLQTHMRIHSGDKPYKCTECGKAFSDSRSLQIHMRIHSGDKPYKCTECGKAFNQSGNLQTHTRIHSGDKPYKCTECGKAFSRSGDLQTHMRIHSGDKPYKCTECGKAFSRSGSLQKHMRIHSGDKPYKCTECGKAFNQSGNLQKHTRIHNRKSV